jgi:hypothetical protein
MRLTQTAAENGVSLYQLIGSTLGFVRKRLGQEYSSKCDQACE